jgi:hypothetical protein
MIWKLQNSIKVGISNRFAALNYSDVNTDISKAWANIRQNIKTLIKRSILDNCEVQQNIRVFQREELKIMRSKEEGEFTIVAPSKPSEWK